MSKNKAIRVKRKPPYFEVYGEWFDSPAYRDLSLPARCLLLEFQHIYRPGRNGRLSLSVKRAMEWLGCAQESARGAVVVLTDHGFMKLFLHEMWQERRAREWILTFEPLNNKEPSDKWQEWKPGQPVFTLPRKSMQPRKAA